MKENLIFKAIVGSQSYGTQTPESDIDFKGVYMQSDIDILTFNYKQQIEVGKDECYYEVRRFLELLGSANPTVLELLYSPEDCIIQSSPIFDLIVKHRDKFLTKKCLNSFGGYAVAQIKKAKGLDKKMNWEKAKIERKSILDFCFVITPIGSRPLKDWLRYQKGDRAYQTNYGVSCINHAKDLYFIYPSNGSLGYHGIANEAETSNDLRLSSIPVSEIPKGTVMSYNKDGYMMHCKDYREYNDWLSKRNTQRYVDIEGHNQQIDGKNILHCRRLLDTAKEIATLKTIQVRRPNAEYLLKIRKGLVPLQEIIDQSEQDIADLNLIFQNSDLPEDIDPNFTQELLTQIRQYAKA